MSELLPCPFCGGEASVKVLEYDDDCKVWGVFCESDLHSEYSHGHYVDNYPTEAEAIAAWNTRAEYHGYEDAAVDAWERIKAYQERTCKFIDDSDGEFPPKCSSCGYEPSVYECAWLANDGYVYEGNYCPNCGARVTKSDQDL